ncbi:glycosyl transferase family A [Clostridium acetobutylicum]|nr:glycosyl transferase family A [Clostridium acetobutylicum]
MENNKIKSQEVFKKEKNASEITVFIPSFNPGRFLRTALKSVYWQTYRNWKLILVDDCSTDNSLDMAKDLLEDTRITVIKNTRNLGQSEAQNKALEFITTPYCVQLDSDDWFFPNALEKLLKTFRKQPEEVAVVSGNVLITSNEITWFKLNNGFLEPNIRKGRFFKDKYDFLLSNLTLWPRCYRTSALKKIGGWPTDDPYGGRHMEDRRVLLRLIEKNRFYWIDNVLYVYRRHDYNNTNKLDVYNSMIEWETRRVLKRWGDKFKPIFKMDKSGWRYIDHFVQKRR